MSGTVLFVAHSSGHGGAERSLLDLVLNCPSHLTPIVLVPGEGRVTKILDKHNIKNISLPYTWWVTSYYRSVATPVHLSKTIYSYLLSKCEKTLEKVDVLYTNTVVCPMGGLLSRKLSVPNIWHIHEFVKEDHGYDFDIGTELSMNFVERTSNSIIYNSNAVKKKFSRYFNDISEEVIYNGPISKKNLERDDVRTEGITDEQINLLVVGDIREGKGQQTAIEILSSVIEKGIDAELYIVGTGDESYISQCQTVASELGIQDHVHWEGYVDNLDDYYRSMDVKLVPSRSEAFGRVVVEAMSRGLPVVGRNSGGIPEIITSGEDGFLFSSTKEAAAHVDHLASDADLYRSISENGWITVRDRFTKELYCDSVYDHIQTYF